MSTPSRVIPTTTTYSSLPPALVLSSAASTVTPSSTRVVAIQLATAHNPSLLPVSAPMSGPLATSAAPLHSSLTHVTSSSVPIFSSANSSQASFKPFSTPFENQERVVSVAIDYTPYYWQSRDIVVDLPLRVAVAARRPDTNSCEVIYDVRVMCSREWHYSFDDADALIHDTSDEYAATVLRARGDPERVTTTLCSLNSPQSSSASM